MQSQERQNIEKVVRDYIGQSKVKQYMSKEILEVSKKFVDIFISNLTDAFVRILSNVEGSSGLVDSLNILLQGFSIKDMSYDMQYVYEPRGEQKNKIYFSTLTGGSSPHPPSLQVEVNIHPLFPTVFEFSLQSNPLWLIEVTDFPLQWLGSIVGAPPKLQELYIIDLYIRSRSGVTIHFDMSLFHTNFNLVHDPSTYGGWVEILCQHIARSLLLFHNINNPQENDVSKWVNDVRKVLWREISSSAKGYKYLADRDGRKAFIIYRASKEASSLLMDNVQVRLLGETTPLYRPRSVEKTSFAPVGYLTVYLWEGGKVRKELGDVVIYMHLSLTYDYYEILQLLEASFYLSARVRAKDGTIISISGEEGWWGTVVEIEDGRTLPPPKQVVQRLIQNIGDIKGLEEMLSSISYRIATELVYPEEVEA